MKSCGRIKIISLAIYFLFPCLSILQIQAENIKPGSSRLTRTGLWDKTEITIINNKPYKDPFKDVQLNVTCTAQGGKEIAYQGFYDGDKTWRFRFMADQTGIWKYRAVFSDGTPGAEGRIKVVKSNLPGMLSANQGNPLWFAGREKQLIIRGFHVGDRFFADNWPQEKRETFLDWAGSQGYNFLTIASHYLNRNEEGRGKGWKTPKLWPLDPAEFRKMEVILDDLARRRIYVYPFAGFFGKNSDYPKDPADQESYIRYTLARIAPYWNVVFNVAGPEPNLGKSWMASGEVERFGKFIHDQDVFDHLLTVHNATGDDPYINSDWTSFGTLQGPKSLNRDTLSAGLLKNHHPAKPLLAQETLWAGNKYHPVYTNDDLRKNAIVIQMSAAALVFGDFSGDSSSGFSGSMELSYCNNDKHALIKAVWDFFESISWHQMKPARHLTSSGFCLAQPGKQYLIYLENGGIADVNIEPGKYKVTWINARNTKERRYSSTKTGLTLQAPDEKDWFLHLVKL